VSDIREYKVVYELNYNEKYRTETAIIPAFSMKEAEEECLRYRHKMGADDLTIISILPYQNPDIKELPKEEELSPYAKWQKEIYPNIPYPNIHNAYYKTGWNAALDWFKKEATFRFVKAINNWTDILIKEGKEK